jgi:hypothetical protein
MHSLVSGPFAGPLSRQLVLWASSISEETSCIMKAKSLLCVCQEVILVHTNVLGRFLRIARAAPEHHDPSSRIRLTDVRVSLSLLA